MNENEIRTRLNDAIGKADYPPALRRQIESRIAEPEVGGHTRLLSMIAAVLALLTVVSLVYVRFQSTRPTIPAATPGPSTRIPAPVLRAAQIEAASGLISEPNLAGTVGDRTVTLEGVYADELNMALIFRVSPATTTPLAIGLWDECGPLVPSAPMNVATDGYQYLELLEAPYVSAGGVAHLKGSIWDHWTRPTGGGPAVARCGLASGAVLPPPSPPPASPPPAWGFTYNLKVQAALAALPVQQGPIAVGSWKVTFAKFELTPSTIFVSAVVDGILPSPDVPGPGEVLLSFATMRDDTGAVVRNFGSMGRGSLQLPSHTMEVRYWWPMPPRATTYHLEITGGGGQYSIKVNIPAPATR